MPATRYRAPPFDGLRIVPLDDLVAIYHRASGVTHVVVSPVPELLELLADSWMTLDILSVALAARYEVQDGAEGLVARIEELVAAGLVEAA